MWAITTDTGRSTSIESLMDEYDDLYAADESGFEVDPQQMIDAPEMIADAGYAGREYRRILFWANEAESDNDPGQNAVAEARWEE